MRMLLVFFLLATVFFHYHRKPFDQPAGLRVAAGEAVEPRQRLRPVPRRLAAAPAASEYRRNLSGVRLAYRYALTDAERRATHSLLTQVIAAVRPAPSARLAANEIATSAYLRRAEFRPAYQPAYVSPERQSRTARVRAFGRVGDGDLGASDRDRPGDGPAGITLAALAVEDRLPADAGDEPAATDADAAATPAPAPAVAAEAPRRRTAVAKATRTTPSTRLQTGRERARLDIRLEARQRTAKRDKVREASRVAARRGNRLPKPFAVGVKVAKSAFAPTSGSARGRSFGFNVVGGSISFSN